MTRLKTGKNRLPACFHLKRLLEITLLFAFAVIQTGCRKQFPPDLSEQTANWFVNNDTAFLEKLSKYNPSLQQIDSLLNCARFKNASKQPHVITLKDISGTPYSLGVMPTQSISKDSLYPLVVYLHGGTGTHLNTKGEAAYLMLSPLMDSVSMFLASPSANRNAVWWSKAGQERILQSVRYMTLNYPVDPDRIILAGVSDGATGCWAALNSINSPFAGFIAVSGFGGMLPQLGIKLAPLNLRLRPVYNVNAGLDHLYPLFNVEQFIKWCKDQGVAVQSTIYQNEKHGFDYRDREFSNIASLIRQWRKPGDDFISCENIPQCAMCAGNLISWTHKLNSRLSDSFLHCIWHGDTLETHADNLESAIVCFNACHPKRITVRNKGVFKTYIKKKPTVSLILKTAENSCFPSAKDYSVYELFFK